MNIRSTQSGCTPKTQTDRAGGAPAARSTPPSPDKAAAPPEATAVDRVELSPAARELASRLEPVGATDTALTTERMREIATRIGNGTYERPEIIDRVLERIAAGLARPESRS